jgi:hypothetical protein
VKHPVNAQLQREAARFALRFACEDCVHFDADRVRCTHGYVERPSRADLAELGGLLAFCKEFELDEGK